MACHYDETLGPVLPQDANAGCRTFDFTLAFEDLVFTLMPCLPLLPVVAYSIHLVVPRPKIVDWRLCLVAKAALYTVLFCLQLAIISLHASRSSPASASYLSIPAASVALLTTASLAILSLLDHARYLRPCLIAQFFLLITLLLDSARLRSTWLISNGDAIAILYAAAFVSKASLLVVESLHKTQHFVENRPEYVSREEFAGFFSRSMMLWLVPLFRRGYQQKLTIEDLHRVDDDLGSQKVTDALAEAWLHIRAARRRRLALSLAKAFAGSLALVHVPRLALVAFALTQPLLIASALEYVQDHASLSVKFGQALIGAFALNYTAVAVSTLWYQHLTFRLITMVRGALIGLIFRHSLTLPASSAAATGAEAVSLMNTDVQRIIQTLQWVFNILPDVVQVAVGLYLLEHRLGAVFVAPLIVAILCGLAISQIGKLIPKRQRKWMQAIQKRTGLTSDIISSVKGIKISGLSEFAAEKVQNCRNSEMDDQKAFRRLQISIIALGNTPAMLTPAVTFTAFAVAQSVNGGNQFQVTTAFSSLSLLAILIAPVAELVTAVSNLTSALNCLDRVQEFLQKEPLEDLRVLSSTTPSLEHGGRAPSARDSQIIVSEVPQRNDDSTVIRITEGAFGYPKGEPVLSNINIDIKSPGLVMIVGSVGCGKSTFLRTILGETKIFAGSVECISPKQFAYCDQNPWILSISIKENILGISEYNEMRYREILEACQLVEDLEQLPLGDETHAGSKGVSLSGGQRSRLALARAAYSGKEVILMDDSLSGLDSTTCSLCFHALLGSTGLFRKERRTVVFATNDTRWLRFADEIIVLDQDGRVSARGAFDTLSSSNIYIRDIILSKKSYDQHITETEVKEGELGGTPPESRIMTKQCAQVEESKSSGSEESPPEATQSNALLYYVSMMGRGNLLAFASLVLLHIACNMAQPLWLKFWVAANTRQPNTDVGRWVGVYVAFSLGTILFIGIETGFFLLVIIPKLSRDIHRRILDATLGTPLSFFSVRETGDVVNLFTGDLNLIDLGLPISFLLTSEGIAKVMAEIVLTCIASGYLALSIPLLVLTIYAVQRVYRATSRQLRVLELQLKGPLFSGFLDTFGGLATIRAFSWTSAAERQLLASLDVSQRPFYLLFCLQRWLTLVLDLVTAGLATLLIGLAVALRNSMDAGLLGVALVSVMGFGQIVSALILQWTSLDTSLGSVRRIADFVEMALEQSEESDSASGTELVLHEKTSSITTHWPSAGEVVFTDVAAAHGDHVVLSNVNVIFAAGSRTAICGRTGSGKSTLLGLILGVSRPQRGRISVDGLDISGVSLKTLRRALVGLPQDALLLQGSVRENLDPFGTYEHEDLPLEQALEKVGLVEVIMEKGGLDVDLDIDWLSNGQRQLFCLARVMLRKSRVLLLDEATSSLDSHFEEKVNKLVDAEFAGWTVITVTHRLGHVAAPDSKFDRVIVLSDGGVAEWDDPRVLMDNPNSLFRTLVTTNE